MSCPQDELLAALRAGDLAPSEEVALEAHLAACAICREAHEENEAVARTLRALPLAQPSDEAKGRAYRAVLAAMEKGAPPKVLAKPPQVARPEAPRRRFVAVVGGLAAAACLLVTANLFFGTPDPTSRTRSVAKVDVETPAAGPRRGLLEKEQADAARPATPPAPPEEPKPAAKPEAPRPAAPTGGVPAPGGAVVVGKDGVGKDDKAAQREVDRSTEVRALERRALVSEAREVLLIAQVERLRKVRDEERRDAPGKGRVGDKSYGEGKDSGGEEAEKKKAEKGADRRRLRKPAPAEEPKAPPPARAPSEDEAPPLARDEEDSELLYDPIDGQRAALRRDGSIAVIPESVARASSNAYAGIAPVGTDAATRALLVRLLDLEARRQPRDERWALRVLGLARQLGIDDGGEALERMLQRNPAPSAR